jgi:alkylation response protein AidB-like acyl-CoA dehydrogenase
MGGWRLDNDLQQMLRESAQNFLGEAGGAKHFRNVRASADGFDAQTWARMGELGWTGILLPEALGGSELGLDPALTLAEEFGQSLSPEPFVASAIIAGTLLAISTAAAGAELARTLAAGSRSVTLAWQERSGQVGRPEFETNLAAGRLNGRKLHVPGWHGGTGLLVAAAGEKGPVVLVIDPHAAGVTIAARRMTDGTLEAEIGFAGVAVADDAVILQGVEAAAALDLALARGTTALCAELEGLSSRLWRLTAEYMKQRVQFEQPLADYQALRHRMVDLYSAIELAAASWRKAASALEAGETGGLAVHAAKARCSDTALTMSRWAIQYHGAFGYTDEADVGLYVHSALRWSSWLGNAVAHRRKALAAHAQGRCHDV